MAKISLILVTLFTCALATPAWPDDNKDPKRPVVVDGGVKLWGVDETGTDRAVVIPEEELKYALRVLSESPKAPAPKEEAQAGVAQPGPLPVALNEAMALESKKAAALARLEVSAIQDRSDLDPTINKYINRIKSVQDWIDLLVTPSRFDETLTLFDELKDKHLDLLVRLGASYEDLAKLQERGTSAKTDESVLTLMELKFRAMRKLGDFYLAIYLHHHDLSNYTGYYELIKRHLPDYLKFNPQPQDIWNFRKAFSKTVEQKDIFLTLLDPFLDQGFFSSAKDFLETIDLHDQSLSATQRVSYENIVTKHIPTFLRLNPSAEEVVEYKKKVGNYNISLTLLEKYLDKAPDAASFIRAVVPTDGEKVKRDYRNRLQKLIQEKAARFDVLNPSLEETEKLTLEVSNGRIAEPKVISCNTPGLNLRTVDTEFRCETSKHAVFERVEAEDFGEAWKDSDGHIWSDLIPSSGANLKDFRRALEKCKELHGDVPTREQYERGLKLGFEEVLPAMSQNAIYWSNSIAREKAFYSDEYRFNVDTFNTINKSFAREYIGVVYSSDAGPPSSNVAHSVLCIK